jgi:hypothetical protein
VTGSVLSARDDLRHAPADGQKARDSLYFNLIMSDEEVGVMVYTWADEAGVAGRLLTAWGRDRRPLAFDIAHGVQMGDADFDDWRIDGLEITHPEPLRTASVRYSGQDMDLAYDFEGLHEAFDYTRNPGGCPQWMAVNRFEQTGHVRGELRIPGRTIDFDQLAHRDHSWGRRNWRMPHHWKWVVAQTASGAALNLFHWLARGEHGVNGYVLRDGEPIALVDAKCHAEYDRSTMVQTHLRATLVDQSGLTTELVLERFGNVELPVGSDTVLNEAACHGTIDGEPAWGQFEAHWPASYVRHLVEAR